MLREDNTYKALDSSLRSLFRTWQVRGRSLEAMDSLHHDAQTELQTAWRALGFHSAPHPELMLAVEEPDHSLHRFVTSRVIFDLDEPSKSDIANVVGVICAFEPETDLKTAPRNLQVTAGTVVERFSVPIVEALKALKVRCQCANVTAVGPVELYVHCEAYMFESFLYVPTVLKET